MAKVKFNVIDQVTIELAQDAKKGDIINLNEINELDLTVLSSSLRQQMDKICNDRAEKIASEKILQAEQKYQLMIDKEKMLAEKTANENAKNIADKKLEEKQKTIEQLNAEVIKLRTEINSAVEKKQIELQAKIDQKENELKSLKENFQTQLESQKYQLESQHKDELSKKDLEISALQMAKKGQGVKDTGEELERFCENEFKNFQSTGGFVNCELIKDNTAIANENGRRTKADFIFVIRDENNNELTRVCCEMKNEVFSSVNKHKNEDYYDRLLENQRKKNCEYALLVSELEKDDDFIFRQVPNNPKMFIVRPSYFINILNIFYSLTIKCQAEIKNVKLLKATIEEENATKKEVLDYIEGFKNSVLDHLRLFGEKMQKVVENMDKITKAAEDSREICSNWVTKKLNTITNKIMNLSIRKSCMKLFEDD